MSTRKSRGSLTSGTTSRKPSIKPEAASKEDPPEPEKPKSYQPDEVKRELLQSLLTSAVNTGGIQKSFAKLSFFNSNQYFGWFGPNGCNGFGTYTFKDGTTFRGSFENSLTRGLGRYQYRNGSTYEGEFLGGRRHGYGRYKTKRFWYDGYFENGKFHGQGVWKSKTEEENGTYEAGNIIRGEVRDLSGVFKGDFDELTQRRQGTFVLTNGDTYTGNWLNDLFWGFGVYDWVGEPYNCTKPETKYIGYWLNGKRYALGLLRFEHRSIICQWNSDKKSGAGVIIAGNGNYFAGTEMFEENTYKGSHCIKQCPESQELLDQIFRMANPTVKYDTMDEKSCAFAGMVKELVEAHADWFSPIYPIRFPSYEIASLIDGPSGTELRFVQQVLSENYNDFQKLYQKYMTPADECMNNLSLNLFYMDVLQKVTDVSIFSFMKENQLAIRRRNILDYENELCNRLLGPVSFYEFFQHFLRITQFLMCNEELRRSVERFRPTFFGHLAIQVLMVLKMLQTQEGLQFLVRDAIQANRPAVLNIIAAMEELSPKEKSLRTAYRYLHKKKMVNKSSQNFTQAVGKYFGHMLLEGMLRETDVKVSELELVEVVLYACQVKMYEDAAQQERQLLRQKKMTLKAS